MNELSLPESPHPRVVIIGGGFGGITLARKLRGRHFQVVLLDRHNYHTFLPLLYQVATGGLEADSVAYPIRKIFHRQRNFYFRMANVERIDTDTRNIITNAGTVTYDYLVIATGSNTNFFGLADAARHAMQLKSVPHALDVRSLLLQNFEKELAGAEKPDGLLNIIVVGGGPTGVEVAGALAEFRAHVVPSDYPEIGKSRVSIRLVEASDRLLGAFATRSGKAARTYLEELDVDVSLQTTLKSYDGTVALMGDGTEVHSSCVIWCAGVTGDSPTGLGDHVLDKNGRLRVDGMNRLKGHEAVFAIGDVALMETDKDYPNGHPMVAQVALQQGRLLAANLVRLTKGQKTVPFRYRELGSLATVGRNKAVAEFPLAHFRGLVAWLLWMGIHLMQLVGFRNRMVVLVNWVWSYWSYDRAIRLIIRPFKKVN